MEKTHLKFKKNSTRVIGIIVIILVIILFSMNKTIKSACEKAVSDYHKQAKSFQIWDKSVANWNSIIVDYIWRLKNWEVFDTSIESIAKACWSYQTWRDYSQWLSFQAWAWQMIAWFDAWVIWMKIWETKTINIPFMQAYWARDEKKLLKMDFTKIPNPEQYKEWMTIMSPAWPIKVYKITKTEITFDTNHMLAGKDLMFDITIKDIK